MPGKAETLKDPASRMLKACVCEALERLEKPRLSETDLHGARKALKKARAALRLLRSHAGETFYQQENQVLRDAGRQLSPMRDAAVLAESLKNIRRDRDFDLTEPAARAAAQVLQRERQEAARKSQPQSAAVRYSKQLLKQHLRRFRNMQPPTLRSSESDLRHLYRKGRKAAAAALDDAAVARLHEWRKQAKYLRSALSAADDLSPKRIAKFTHRLHSLTDHLGDDHDLAVLEGKLADLRPNPLGRREQESVEAQIEKRRRRIQRKALRLGRKVFRRKPRRLMKRLSR